MPDHNKNIFTQRLCLAKEELISYANGTLPQRQAHYVESHLLDCELCSDALEGIIQLREPGHLIEISNDLVRTMNEKKIINENKPYKWYLAAAIVAVFLLSGIYFKFIYNADSLKQNYADLPEKKSEVKSGATSANMIIDAAPKLQEEKKSTGTFETTIQQVAKLQREKVNNEPSLNSTITVNQKTDKLMVATDSVAVAEPQAIGNNEIKVNESAGTAKPMVAESPAVEKQVTTTGDNAAYKDRADGAERYKKESVNGLMVLKSKNAREDSNALITDAQKKIEDQNYKDALKQLKIVLQNEPSNVDALYYSGVTYYNTDEETKAIQYFDKTLENSDKKHYEDARWYKVLTYVKINDKENARKIINRIIAEKGPYKNRAEDLLEMMGGN